MDYSSYLPFFDQNSIALSIPVVLLTLIVGLVVSTLSKERPWPGFDVISLDEKGLSPKDSWITYGKEVLAKGRKHVRLLPMQLHACRAHLILVDRWRFSDRVGYRPKDRPPKQICRRDKESAATEFQQRRSDRLFCRLPRF